MKSLPWVITIIALYYAFRGIRIDVLLAHTGDADLSWIAVAVLLTCISYLLRSWRWLSLFPEHTLHFLSAARVLILGFFMNNILPARAGELVRAHMGAKLGNQTRTLVLATIASERLVDGLTISFMFVAFALGIGDSKISRELLYVAYLFAAAGIAVLIVIAMKDYVFRLAEKIHKKIETSSSSYALNRLQVFINGLTPLSTLSRLPTIIIFSVVVWGVELCVYKAVTLAFAAELTWAQCVLFLVAVNFASLIPAAPGGVGVIEAIASAVLVSIGIGKEQALTMVIAQHIIQYLVVGIPGSVIMFNWKKILDQVRHDEYDQQSETCI